PPPDSYPLSLHDALPISLAPRRFMSINPIDLSPYGLTVDNIVRNATPARLYEYALMDRHAAIAGSGALATRSGDKTGRSPKDKRSEEHTSELQSRENLVC